MKQVWETEDGKTFDNKAQAEKHEVHLMGVRHLEELIDDEVPYSENQIMVRNFILENSSSLSKILADIG